MSGAGRRAALLALFLLSGATALVYEVSWTRRLVLLVGSTSTATALLLAAYMLGLALGAALGGPLADRARRPLRLYAGLEAGAAALALLLPFLLDGLQGIDALVAAGREPLLFSAAFVVLLLPTTLLGATLPALTRVVVDDPAVAGPRVGMLYAANTLGAVAGAIGAGFLLVEALGVDGSARLAAVVSFGIAGAAWLLGGNEAAAADAPPAEDPRDSAPAPGGPVAEGPSPAEVRAALAAAFAGGFVGLAAEVAWTRLLVFTLQGFTAAFSAMLGSFLLGSALGGAWFARVAGRSRRPLELLGWIQVGAAVASAGTLAALYFHYDLVQWIRGALPAFASPRANHQAVLLVAAFAVLGPPAFFMGGVFPVSVRAAAGGLGDLGARVGRVYAANTVGAVLGSLAAGFVGVPLLGARGTAAAVAVLSLLAGLATLARPGAAAETVALRARRRIAAAAAGAAVVLLVVLGRPGEPMILRSQVFLGAKGKENELVESREGRAGLASVVRNVRNGFTSLYTDEFLAASTEGRYRYMRMLGHIPVVLAAEPKHVLVMAFGTGTTAGSLSTHPSVETLDVVEISKEVLDLAPHFASVNREVVARAGKGGAPEVRLHVDDARRFVLASRGKYDVITLEPLMPYTPGAVHLYTREFYDLCRARLAPGGALCQWFPIHAMSSADFRLLAAAFVEAFPESSLWFVEETAALVGTTGPQGIPVKRSADRLSAPGPREDLEAGRLDDLAQWWSFRVCGGEALREWTRGVRGMTDEHPDIEFHPVPSGTLTTYLNDNLAVFLELQDADAGRATPDLRGLKPADAATFAERFAAASEATATYMAGRAHEDVFSFHASHTRLPLDPRAREFHERKAVDALRDAGAAYAAARQANPRDRIVLDRWKGLEMVRLLNEGRAHLRAGRLEEAERAYGAATAVDAPWNRDEAFTGLGRVLLRLGKPLAARDALGEALRIYRGNRDALALMGEALTALGSLADARTHFAEAYEGGSGPADEDPATVAARAVAERGGEGAGPAALEAAEAREYVTGILEQAAGPKGAERDRAIGMLRVIGRGADPAGKVLAAEVERALGMARNGAAPPAERVRALSILAAVREPGAGALALAVAKGAGSDRALAAAAVDAAGEGGGAEALAAFVDPANGLPSALRSRALDRLAGIREARSMDAVLDALGDADPAVRTAAFAALFRLADRKDFDPDAPEADRRAALERLRTWWSAARPAWK